MEIEYLVKMKNTPKIGYRENKGVSEQEIQMLEQKMNVKLPQAYKEFLYLGGKYDNIINNFELTFDWLPNMQKDAQKAFQKEELVMRPFWCFAEYNHAESSLFFFLDEGDNPPVYSFIADKGLFDEEGNEVSYQKFRNSFSEYIDRCIEAALK